MKGVSAVIAIVLILMITVALAAMSYVWFTNIFETLTESGTSSIQRTSDTLQAFFTIESARHMNVGNISVSIRNTGASIIELDKVALYLNGVIVAPWQAPTGILGEGSFTTTAYIIDNSTSGGSVCPGPSTVTVTIGQGYSQTRTVSCS